MGKGEETRQFIIEKAAPIFNTKGIAATAMSDIMEATKLSKGSMYVHFENKDVLAAAAVDYNMDTLEGKLLAALRGCNSPKDKLLAYIDFFSDPNTPPVAGGCPILNFGTEADDTNPSVRDKVQLIIKRGQKLLRGMVAEAIAAGELKAETNPEELATVIFATLEGAHLMSRVAGRNDSMNIAVRSLKKWIAMHNA